MFDQGRPTNAVNQKQIEQQTEMKEKVQYMNFPYILVNGKSATLLVNTEKLKADVLMLQCPRSLLAQPSFEFLP